MAISWILIANSSTAGIYSSPHAKLIQGKPTLVLIKHIEHPDSRKKCKQTESDKLGSYKNGTFVESSDPKHHQATVFAKELAQELNRGRIRHLYDDLVIAAPSEFHGRLNQAMNGHMKKVPRVDIQKDYTHDDPQQLVKHLREHL